MQVIPAINCSGFECVKKRLAQIEELGGDWAHIDIADGRFAPTKTWNNPQEVSYFTSRFPHLNIEVHLMVQNPETVVESWLRVGTKRIIVHLESFRDREEKLSSIFEMCAGRDAEAMLAINPETPVEGIFPYLDSLLFVQVLAVSPGPAGQKFNESVIQKIEVLRERAPNVLIEVDGGMNPETARLVRSAGADIIVSGSYIFDSEKPAAAYETLLNLE